MKRVVVESPFSGRGNKLLERVFARYCNAAMRDCLQRGEAPFASHAIYTRVLDDDVPEDRMLGIHAGFAWAMAGVLTAVYIDYGVSDGMRLGIGHAQTQGRPIENRMLPGWGPGGAERMRAIEEERRAETEIG